MAGIAGRVLSQLPLALSVAVVALSVRSHCFHDHLQHEWWATDRGVARQGWISLLSADGHAYLSRAEETADLGDRAATRPAVRVSSYQRWNGRTRTGVPMTDALVATDVRTRLGEPPGWARVFRWAGLGYRNEERKWLENVNGVYWACSSTHRAVGVPYWTLAAVAGGWPVLHLVRHACRLVVRRRRRRDGHCALCDYDLCGSPTRCPECGTPAPPPGLGSGKGNTVRVAADAPATAAALMKLAPATAAWIALCAAAAALSLVAARDRGPMTLAAERQMLDRVKAIRGRRLIASIDHPATPRSRRSLDYERLSDLRTAESARYLASAYAAGNSTGVPYPAGEGVGLDVIGLLWRNLTPAAAPHLLRMIHDDPDDYRRIEAYAAAAGDEGTPELRRLALEHPDATCRGVAEALLLRRKEPRAVAELLAELRIPSGARGPEGERLDRAIHEARQASVTEAVPALRRIADACPRDEQPGRYAAVVEALLILGDWENVSRGVCLLEAQAAESPYHSGSDSLTSALRHCTGVPAGRDARVWRCWWDVEGNRLRGPIGRALVRTTPPSDAEAVEKSFLEFVRTCGGLAAGRSVVYVEDAGRARRSTEGVRYYHESDLRLLDVDAFRILAVFVDGNRAYVNFDGPGRLYGRDTTLELTRAGGGWTVRGYAHPDSFFLDDDRL